MAGWEQSRGGSTPLSRTKHNFMEGSRFQNFDRNYHTWKNEQEIKSDPDQILEGLWSLEQEREIKKFEHAYPGISNEFDTLISLLPDPDKPEKSEFPFAASVVRITKDGKMEVLARSANRVNKDSDSTQHAELAVLQDAQKKIGKKHLDGYILLSTAQPCEMCAGAIRHTGLDTIVYAISQKDLNGTHVQFKEEFKPHRTVPTGFDIDGLLRASGVTVFAGYKHDEVLKKLKRFTGTLEEYYKDPDA